MKIVIQDVLKRINNESEQELPVDSVIDFVTKRGTFSIRLDQEEHCVIVTKRYAKTDTIQIRPSSTNKIYLE